MASRINLFRQDDFTGGLNLRSDQFQLAGNESPDLLNMEIDPRGGLFSRGAMKRQNTNAVATSWTPRNLYQFSGATRFAMISTATEVYSSDTSNTNTKLTVALATTATSGAGGVATITTATAHGFTAGQTVVVAGVTPTGYNGTYTILATPTTTTFTYTNATTGAQTVAGTATSAISVVATHGAAFAQWGATCYMTPGATGASCYKYTSGALVTTLTVSATSAWQESYQTPTGTHMPKCNLMISHAGKMFVADTNENGTSFPNRLRWSHPNSPESWASLDYIDINDGSSGITGLASFNGSLLIFKDNATYLLLGYDSTTFQIVEVSRKIGCLSPQCVATTERGVFFWSSTDGLMQFNGKGLVNLFEPLITAIQLGQINSTAKTAHYVNEIAGRIWVSVPYSTTTSVSVPSTSFIYDPSIGKYGSWTRFSNTVSGVSYGIAGGCTFIAASGTVLRLALHPNVAAILKVDDYSNDTDSITSTSSSDTYVSYYRTRWVDGGSYSQKKMFRRPDLVLKQVPTNRTVQVDVYQDYEESTGAVQKVISIPITGSSSGMLWNTGVWGTGKWGGANVGAFVQTISSIGLARAAQIVINGPTGVSGSRYWGIDSMTLKYIPRKVRA